MEEEPRGIDLRAQLWQLFAKDAGDGRSHGVRQWAAKEDPLLDVVPAGVRVGTLDLLLGWQIRSGIGFLDDFGDAGDEGLEVANRHYGSRGESRDGGVGRTEGVGDERRRLARRSREALCRGGHGFAGRIVKVDEAAADGG